MNIIVQIHLEHVVPGWRVIEVHQAYWWDWNANQFKKGNMQTRENSWHVYETDARKAARLTAAMLGGFETVAYPDHLVMARTSQMVEATLETAAKSMGPK